MEMDRLHVGHGQTEDETAAKDQEEARLLEAEDSRLPPAATTRERDDAGLSVWQRVVNFLDGPRPPRPQTIAPVLPLFQERWRTRLGRWENGLVLGALGLCWAGALLHGVMSVMGRTADEDQVRLLTCFDALWPGPEACRVDGAGCRPFSNLSFAFRCPANCAGATRGSAGPPHYVGALALDGGGPPLVVGGPVYRGDSSVCAAAVHAGVVEDASGGCGLVEAVGAYYGFFPGERNGVSSVGFPSHFPLSFVVEGRGDDRAKSMLPWWLLGMSLLASLVLSVVATSPDVVYLGTFTAAYAHVYLLAAPRLSWLVLVGRSLAALFCAAALRDACMWRALGDLRAPIERTALWLVPFWLGALFSPRGLLGALLGSDADSGLELLTSMPVLVLVFMQQVRGFWLEGRLRPLVGRYALSTAVVLVLLGLAAADSLSLRLPLYVFAVLVLLSTDMETPFSLLYQGLFLGLFVGAVARSGFPPPFTSAVNPLGHPLDAAVPDTVDPLIWGRTISFKWRMPSGDVASLYDGISVLVNDVERHRRFFADEALVDQSFTWRRDATLTSPEFFRFAYLKGQHASPYSVAGTWFPNASWSRGPGYW